MWYFRSSTQLIFPVVRSLSQITDQTRIPLPSHHLKYGKGWSRGCEFRGETWYNKVRYMRNFPFGSSICSCITICMRMYAMGQVRWCFVEPWGPRWCKCGNLILFFFLLQARNFECTSSEIDEIARDEGRDKERKSRGLWWGTMCSGTRILKVLATVGLNSCSSRIPICGISIDSGLNSYATSINFNGWLLRIVAEFITKTSSYNIQLVGK